MPVVLALGEELHASGKQALLSYIVGFDITTNVTQAWATTTTARAGTTPRASARWAPLPRRRRC